jgi:hypothetical protein
MKRPMLAKRLSARMASLYRGRLGEGWLKVGRVPIMNGRRIVGVILALGFASVLFAPHSTARSAPTLQSESEEAVGRAAIEAARANGTNVAVALMPPVALRRFGGNVAIAGWAADLLPNGPGVDPTNLQVWIERPERRPLGVASYGIVDPTPRDLLGDDRFTNTGFQMLWASCTFPPGDYRATVYAWRQGTDAVGVASTDAALAPCPIPADRVIFRDALDGTNPFSPDWSPWWRAGSGECSEVSYSGGEYRVRRTAVGPPTCTAEDSSVVDQYRTVYADVAMEVDVRLVDPTPTAFASIGFRLDLAEQSASLLSGYAVHLNPTLGTVALVFDRGDSYTRLAEVRPPALRTGTETNRVGIVGQGSRLRVLVNGEQVIEVTDDRHPWGVLALGSGAPGGQGADAAYRNLVVRYP